MQPPASPTYQFFKDFAGPIATLIAAGTAGLITLAFARIQANLARSQRDIALDKLKFDLFEKRYEIYQATKTLLEYVPFVTDLEKLDATKVRSLAVTIDEARFYYPPEICTFLHDTRARCETFFGHLGQRELISIDDSQKWGEMAETLAKDQQTLRIIYASLPQIFEDTLAFKQLTTENSEPGR
jgi:hypothetical protein